MNAKKTGKACIRYKPIEKTIGICFGHAVPVNMPAEKCPAKAFELRDER